MTGHSEREQRETRPQRLSTERHQLGTLGDFKSERWATSSRNAWATSSEYATDLRGVANGMRITVQWLDGGKNEGAAADLFEMA